MPFKSKAQWRACYAKRARGETDWDCEEFARHSPPYERLKENMARYGIEEPDMGTDDIDDHIVEMVSALAMLRNAVYDPESADRVNVVEAVVSVESISRKIQEAFRVDADQYI